MFGDYRDNLYFLHRLLNPNVYLEVGVANGASLALVNNGVSAYGVDPKPTITATLKPGTVIYQRTSDDFFSQNAKEIFENKKIDFAFIDGMHLFEYALRDFINIEKYCTNKSIITIHDIYPKCKVTSARNRITRFWTGDVYKIVLALKKYRPDLKFYNSDIPPAGLAIIGNLNPNSDILEKNYNKIINEFMNFEYEALINNKRETLSIMPDSGYKEFVQTLL